MSGADEQRFYEVSYYGSSRTSTGAMQKTIGIKCPFCECITDAYAWSLAGSGKRCNSCTAVHHYHPQISVRAKP